MLFFKTIFTLVCLAGLQVEAGQLRNSGANNNKEPSTRTLAEATRFHGFAFYLESKGYDGFYLQDKTKFVYDGDFHMVEYDNAGRKTGKCYHMGSDYWLTLEDCNYNEVGQKWLVSKAPEEYGHHYILSNTYYGRVVKYTNSEAEVFGEGAPIHGHGRGLACGGGLAHGRILPCAPLCVLPGAAMIGGFR